MSDAAIERIAIEANLSPKALQQALEWLVTLWSRETTPEQLYAMTQWREADPDHERAWQHVQRINDRLTSVSSPVAGASLRAAHTTMTRRNVLRAMGLILVGGTAAYTLRDPTLLQSQLADIRTTTGEIRKLTLEDGTRITVNTASTLNIGFTARERRVRLIDGEILVATAPDPASRPFVVETAG